MAGKISELAALTDPQTTDLVEVVDVSDVSMAGTGTNKRASLIDLATFGSIRVVITYSSTSVTAVLADRGSYVRLTGTNPTYTIPPNSSVAFPLGAQIDGIGAVSACTIAAGAGVTIVKARTLVTVSAGSGWTLIKVGTDTWDCHGDFV